MKNEYMTYILLLVLFLIALSAVIWFLEQKVKKTKRQSLKIMETLIGVIEAEDPNLEGHSMHVSRLVTVFYDYLPEELQHKISLDSLQTAALFHDIGRLGLPRYVISKKGKLSPDELNLLRSHPEVSVEMLRPLELPKKISDAVLYHHERIDGKGYHGLTDDQIPFASKMIAVCDTYSALIMNRSYKPTLTHEEAIVELRQVAGTQLDETLTELFCEIPRHRLAECLEGEYTAETC